MVIWRTSRRYTGIIALTEYMSINFQFAHPYLCVVPRASKNPCLFLQPNQAFLCTVPDSDGCINGWVSNIPNTDQLSGIFLHLEVYRRQNFWELASNPRFYLSRPGYIVKNLNLIIFNVAIDALPFQGIISIRKGRLLVLRRFCA